MIQFGNDKIKNIYVGSDKIKEVYYGSEKVWGEIGFIQDGYWVHKDTGVITYFGLEDSSIEDGIMGYPSWALECSEVQLPSGVTSLGNNCFRDCSSLTSITIPDSVTTFRDYCFAGTSLTSITIPESVNHIGGQCFQNCTALTSVIGLENTGENRFQNCFENCISLTSVTLPPTVTQLFNTFKNCRALTSITIPANTANLIRDCFYGCTALTSIYSLPSTAPGTSATYYPFGVGTLHTGRNTYNQGINMLYVPQGATGYDAGDWLDPLQDATKCGFTISYTL